jgi:hypothetical protein
MVVNKNKFMAGKMGVLNEYLSDLLFNIIINRDK